MKKTQHCRADKMQKGGGINKKQNRAEKSDI